MQPNARHQQGSSFSSSSELKNLAQMEALARELREILDHNSSAFDDENIRRGIDGLERWIDCYRRDLVNADTFCENSQPLLKDLKDRLTLAAEEMQRLEGEGGNPASREQIEKNEELLRALRRCQTLLSNIETVFHPKP